MNAIGGSLRVQCGTMVAMSPEGRATEDSGAENTASPQELPEVPVYKPTLPKRPSRAAKPTDEGYKAGLAYIIPTALIAPIVVLTLGGALLDDKLHSAPNATLIGAVLGSVAGFVNMIRIANRLNK